MTLFSIYEAPSGAAPLAVPDRFSWSAAILPLVYALANRLWLATLGYIVVTAAIVVAARFVGEDAAFWLYVLFAVWIGFAAPGFRRASLRRRGFRYSTERFAAAPEYAEVGWLARRGAP